MRQHVFTSAGSFADLGDFSRFFQVFGDDISTSLAEVIFVLCGIDSPGWKRLRGFQPDISVPG